MSDNFKFVQAQPFVLSGGGAVSGATTIILKSFTQINGTLLTMSDFGSKGFLTLEPGNGTLEEQVSFSGVVQNSNGTATLSGISTVLMVSPYTETSGLAQTHAGSTAVIVSNTAGFYNSLTGKADDETITGTWTFTNPNYPRMDTSTPFPTDNQQLATKAYADSLTFAGAPDATTTQKGIVELATQAEVDAKTATGGTGASLVPTPALARSTLLSDYIADSGSATAYVITPSPAITAYVTGQRFTFKVTNANTTSAPTVAVNGLAAKTIVKQGSNALAAGDIAASQIIEIEYDGTNFQLMTPVATLAPTGSIQMFGGAAAPSGWLLCDATSYLRTDYPALFTVISTTFGSADGTHFNVPDMRGRVPIGVGTGTGGGASGTGLPTGGSALTAVVVAGWKGEQTHTLITAEMPAHTHSLASLANNASGGAAVHVGANLGDTAQTSGSTGGDGAHNNIQPVLGISFIIKT